MAADYKLQIYTQEKKVFEDRVASLVAPGQFGSFGVLAHHAPLVALLGRGKLTIRPVSGREDVIEIDGAFFFGSASQLLDRVDQIIGTRIAVFDCSRVPFMDLSAQFTLEEMIERLRSQDIEALVVVPPALHAQLQRLRAPQLPVEILRDDLAEALAEARARVAAQPG